MGYISKYNMNFLTYMNRKYRRYSVNFEFWDDYALWLFDMCNKKEKFYYKQLEKDVWEYSDFQTGKERDKRGRLISNETNES